MTPVRLVFTYYWNALITTYSSAVYFLPFVVSFQPGKASGKIVAIAMMPFAYFIVAWLIALVQCGMAIHARLAERRVWKHHALSAGWTLFCYLIWTLLVLNGFVVTT